LNYQHIFQKRLRPKHVKNKTAAIKSAAFATKVCNEGLQQRTDNKKAPEGAFLLFKQTPESGSA